MKTIFMIVIALAQTGCVLTDSEIYNTVCFHDNTQLIEPQVFGYDIAYAD